MATDLRNPDANELKKDMELVEHALKRTRVQIAGAKRLLAEMEVEETPKLLATFVHILAINQAAGEAGMR